MTQLAKNPHVEDKLFEFKSPLVVTTGEPAGIGMDIVLQLAAQGELAALTHPIWVLADANQLSKRCASLIQSNGLTCTPSWKIIHSYDDSITIEEVLQNINTSIEQNQNELNNAVDKVDFYVIDIACREAVEAGVLNVANAQMVVRQLELAHHLAITNIACAIVTAPLQKSVLIDADIRLKDGTMFTGHTEYFMQQSGCKKVVMMLANTAMRVALVTTHLPIKEVADAITKDNVQQTVDIVINDLKTKFGLDTPRILVCGLNPHAGEGGHLGLEEIEIINPVLESFQQKGVVISDAMPADTIFTQRHLANCDAVIAMYHDQGLPVLKSHGFGDTVNLTLGLPYIRTSVDHGTALDIAGSGKASATSLWQALKMADTMANDYQCSTQSNFA